MTIPLDDDELLRREEAALEALAREKAEEPQDETLRDLPEPDPELDVEDTSWA